MEQRIDYNKISPGALKALMHLDGYINQSALDHSFLHLIKLRASQINGCAYCVDMHVTDARKSGQSERRIAAVAVWRESPFFNEKERAALAWTEALTLLPQTRAPDEDYQEVLKHYGEKGTVDLTMAIIAINSWNRLGVGFRMVPED